MKSTIRVLTTLALLFFLIGINKESAYAASDLNFNNNAYFEIGNGSQIDSTPKISVQALVKFTSLDVPQAIACKAEGGGFCLEYDVNDKTVQLSLYIDGVYRIANANSSPTLNTWYHIVGTYDGTNIRLYINGVLQDDVQSAPGQATKTPTTPFAIGQNPKAGGGSTYTKFHGYIREVSVWNKALTQTEVNSIRSNGVKGYESGLVGAWKPNSLTTGKVYDLTTKNMDGIGYRFSQAFPLIASSISDLGMNLSWTKSSEISSYKLVRGSSSLYSGTGNSYSEKALVSDTNYDYTLTAISTNGESIDSKTFKTAVGELAILQVPSAINFNPITLNGADQKSYGTFNQKIIVKDTRKSRNGWKLVVKAAPLKSSNGVRTFPSNKIALKPVSAITQTSGAVATKPSITNSTQLIDTSSVKKIVSAGTNTGQGVYEITLPSQALELSVNPSNAYVNPNGSSLNYYTDLTWTVEPGA
ncbi:LamG-like jellyroll fold domain-containing protein [Bacillaceae bacterium CLA-AA-H227]|uniref:LamG-like jellyroll fold domain-containing protein n=2 Tax=Robertmurraya TaxID=2837507 RepID=A0A4U1CZ53_9BACI|nr:LamG-like jellyroll fold domain-containing protein [Robertmurraya kyonggiensis]TKC15172.1 hypothetical protein FA727_20030 [Robertmurraya kyonggiensis]